MDTHQPKVMWDHLRGNACRLRSARLAWGTLAFHHHRLCPSSGSSLPYRVISQCASLGGSYLFGICRFLDMSTVHSLMWTAMDSCHSLNAVTLL